jgi:sulfur carrier protein
VPKVSLNDTLVEVAPNTSLKAALPLFRERDANGSGRRYVVAINKEFVPRSEYDAVILKDGDEIDLVRPVWGG